LRGTTFWFWLKPKPKGGDLKMKRSARILIWVLGIVMPVAAEAQWSLGVNDDNALQVLVGERWQVGLQFRAPRDCRYVGVSFFRFSSPFPISTTISTSTTANLFMGGECVYLPYQKGEINEGDGWAWRVTGGIEPRIKRIGIFFSGGIEYAQRRDRKTGLSANSGINPVIKIGIRFWR